MILSFHPCFVADQQIILGARPLGREDRLCIRSAKAIILPQSCSIGLYRACQGSSALLFPDYDLRFRYPGKFGQSRLFKQLNLPHPFTIAWPSVAAFRRDSGQKEHLSHQFPFLIKADRSHEGEGVWIIKDQPTLQHTMEELSLLEKSNQYGFVSQELIQSEGNVLRAVVLGKKTLTYWKRPDHPQRLLTTAAGGGVIDGHWRIDLQGKGRLEGERLTALTGINVAAIDFVFPFDRLDPDPLFLEINYYFGRRGLGGSENYYRLLFEALREWLKEKGFDPNSVELV
jgi:ribosomal protein S6--L-glutamate ligase